MFAILNYAKITDAPMTGEWVMEVDWVKHEYWSGKIDPNAGTDESSPSDKVRAAQKPIPVPSRIEAELYKDGNGVQSETCTDAGGGVNLGHFDPGDFVEYEILVDQAGEYTIDYRLASQAGSEGFEVLIDNQVVDKQTVPETGGWQSYQTQSSQLFSLSEGQHKLRFRSIGNQWNINWFELKRQ